VKKEKDKRRKIGILVFRTIKCELGLMLAEKF
jgi:hypothetical protein